MKALLRARLHDAVIKKQHFICAVAATDGNWKTESTRSEGLLWWSQKLIQTA